MKTMRLNNGMKIPEVGYGTWRTPNDELCISSVVEAIKCGYTHIDTAEAYQNETSVGKGIKQSGIAREDVFLTTKLRNPERGYDKTIAAFKKSLADLEVDYIDLFLIHWPANSVQFDNYKEINADTWRAFEDLYKEGLVKSIGVSNFMLHNIKDLEETQTIAPMVNQIEFHPGHMQEELIAYCKSKGMVIEAWSPLANGDILDHPTLVEIASTHNKNVAQVVLRWILQHGNLPLTKSVTPTRIQSNIELFDFTLSDEEMKAIDAMKDCGGACANPDTVTF